MPSLKLLKEKQEYLEEISEELLKKLRRLKIDRIHEADSEAKYKLEQRIEEYENQLEEIDEELDSLEEQINNPQIRRRNNLEKLQNFDCLHRVLLKLGYWEQQRLFEEITITRKYSYGAFLIRGLSQEHGQRWLLNRLALAIFKNSEEKDFLIDLNRRTSRTDIAAIWSEFAGRVGLAEDSLPSQIVENIYKLWQSKNVLIAFNNVDESIKENLRDLLDDFWALLVDKISASKNNENKFKLLIFFLDCQGIVINKWNIGFVGNYDSSWEPSIPLGLPEIIPFDDEILRNWIDQQSDNLPENISSDKENTVKILQEKKGIPVPTLRKICDLCGCNWFEQEKKWLRL
ncbi:MAG: hypothetical protein QNJ36_15835 [Calothrix sp. MO_167.B42]|nr:hypothetical protein [Calothrix sp. MO_167.B42]